MKITKSQQVILVLFMFLGMLLAPVLLVVQLIYPIVEHVCKCAWSSLMLPLDVKHEILIKWGVMDAPKTEYEQLIEKIKREQKRLAEKDEEEE